MGEHLEAGPALDAEVNNRVFGCEITCSEGINCADIPPYSTDIAAAMLVLEHLGRYSIAKFDGDQKPYRVQIWGRTPDDRHAWAETLPLAICLAALALDDRAR